MYGDLEKLELFWKHGDGTVKQKILVYDAIVRANLLYGLESAQLNDSLLRTLDTFQLKGLRQIMKIQTTFMDRTNTNEFVYDKVSRVRPGYSRRPKAFI